jgi:hypothetical protein
MKPGLLRCALPVLALFAATGAATAASLVDDAAHALLARAVPVTWIDGQETGSAWKSVVRAPDYGTDREAGAAGTGMGLIAAYDATGNASYLKAAAAAGDFLVAAQAPADSGRWPESWNPDGPTAYAYTSFDNGAAGIADFLWRLYERTGNAHYQSAALAALDWEMSKAEAPKGKSCPSVCFWHWQDPATRQVYTGLGEGVAGIAWTFDAFAVRRAGIDPATSARYEQYAEGAAAWLESQMVHERLASGEDAARLHEEPGANVFDTGFSAGAAGDAFLFYQLYLDTGRAQYRRDGDALLAWVRAQARTDGACGGLKWPIRTSGYGSNVFATGVDEGAAGVGWVALQAYKLLIAREPGLAIEDLETARSAGDWLLSSCAAHMDGGRAYWPELSGRHLVHTGLDTGAAGIGIFLYDLHRATGAPSYHDAATGAEKWVESVAEHGRSSDRWCEHERDGQWRLCGDPSWQWGAAGIAAMAARLQNGPLDMPGGEPGFDRRR